MSEAASQLQQQPLQLQGEHAAGAAASAGVSETSGTAAAAAEKPGKWIGAEVIKFNSDNKVKSTFSDSSDAGLEFCSLGVFVSRVSLKRDDVCFEREPGSFKQRCLNLGADLASTFPWRARLGGNRSENGSKKFWTESVTVRG